MPSPRWLRGGCGHTWCTCRMPAPAFGSGAPDTLKDKARDHNGVRGYEEGHLHKEDTTLDGRCL